jgi:hypothetical protein
MRHIARRLLIGSAAALAVALAATAALAEQPVQIDGTSRRGTRSMATPSWC